VEKYFRTGLAIDYGACVLHAGIPKATNIHSQYVIFIAFLLQQKRASVLRYMYIVLLYFYEYTRLRRCQHACKREST
jgi:hypothetical protein